MCKFKVNYSHNAETPPLTEVILIFFVRRSAHNDTDIRNKNMMKRVKKGKENIGYLKTALKVKLKQPLDSIPKNRIRLLNLYPYSSVICDTPQSLNIPAIFPDLSY